MSQSTTDGTSEEETTATWAKENWMVIVFFTVLTVFAVALSLGVLSLGIVGVDTTHESTNDVSVPGYIYLYASLGALGYIFTKLMHQFESFDDAREIDRLVELALRIPVAWVLGAGTYLLSTVLLPSSVPGTARFTAGFAFLVGLYVNVTMKSLGSLADRLLGRSKGSE